MRGRSILNPGHVHSHITGNLVVIAASLMRGGRINPDQISDYRKGLV
jgi:hypothetical protein